VDIVADANLFLSVILNEPEKRKIVEKTKESDLLAPVILPFEIGNALSAMFKRKRLNDEQCQAALKQFQIVPVRLIDVDLNRALSIAIENEIYAYDAYYLEIAKRLGRPLMTLDVRMREIAIGIGIKVLEVL